MPRTCVFFHAHRDDEAWLTAGTMARLAAEGHRVVLVVAAGRGGLTCLDVRPAAEVLTDALTDALDASAHLLGCARVVLLGYEDSGLDGSALGGFSRANVGLAADGLAELLRQERADLLSVYDPAGGYGHPDHVHVHRVGVRAAELAGTPVVLEATLDRDLLLRVPRPLVRLGLVPRALNAKGSENAYAPRSEITHRVCVRRYIAAKRTALAANVAHDPGGGSACTLAPLLRLPRFLFRRVLGTECFVRRDLPPGTVLDHPLAMWPASKVPVDA
ncbi:PIG-L family deacetylase [Actinomadura viridis]|uniref:LmbE family N-acetylglucosaminyl deacetylase n=1 Tax=Actinomadura viridis TaxID=58110 RepID=A0A931DM90_9ACTN|nr:PIG-L family deacetylase [Actinomadura viridis]MBG6092560.1 LmbE family N-acetylglucosaminyl deacetylase [Actinomadura viridis]